MTNKKLEEKKRKYLKKKITNVITNRNIGRGRNFFQHLGGATGRLSGRLRGTFPVGTGRLGNACPYLNKKK